MAFKPTKEQALAINHQGGIIVSAAAGSGKTAVLVERVIRMLSDKENPVSADKLLVVTFTNAAAAELRGRIDKRIGEALEENPNDLHLRRQRMLLNGAKICTIDAFCLDFLKENFECTNTSPVFKIVDNAQLSIFEKSAMSSVINNHFEQEDREFLALLDFVGDNFDDSKTRSCIKALFDFSRNMPFPNDWLDRIADDYKAHAGGSSTYWFDSAFEIILSMAEEAAAKSEYALHLLGTSEAAESKYAANYIYFDELSKKIIAAAKSKDWNRIFELTENIAPPKCKSLTKEEKTAEIKLSIELRDDVKDVIKKISGFVDTDLIGAKERIGYELPFIEKLVSLVKEFEVELYRLLASQDLVTFYMAEQSVLSAIAELVDGKIVPRGDAIEHAHKYDAILVDEYQDTNTLQDTIFNILSDGGRKLFCVGDVKQSIYKFRGANPSNFLSKKKAAKHLFDLTEKDMLRVDLSSNFRSRPEICGFINSVFEKVIYEENSGFDYDDTEKLNPMAEYPDNDSLKIEEHYLDFGAINEASEEGFDSRIYAEAELVAKRISEIVNEQPFLRSKEGHRKANYGDIAILVRSMGDKGNTFIKVLKDKGIPVEAASSEILDSDEVKTLISLISVINNPTDDVSLLTILTSPIFGFSVSELAQIRAQNRYGSLISSISAFPKGNKKIERFLETLRKLRVKSILYSVSELIEEIFEETGMLNAYSIGPFGEICKGNLLAFLNVALGFESGKQRDIPSFLKCVSELSNRDIGIAGQTGNCVKVMTIHKSKGLQFPICILANASNKFNTQDLSGTILISEKYGISATYFNEFGAKVDNSLIRNIMKYGERSQMLAEELRVFYVALTRAEEKLILISSHNNLKKDIASKSFTLEVFKVKNKITNSMFMETASFSDWLLTNAILEGRIDVNAGESLVPEVFIHEEITKAELLKDETVPITTETQNTNSLKKVFEFSYPFKEIIDIQSKSAVTKIVHADDTEDFSFTERPAFLRDQKISYAELGTAVHKVMQYGDYSECRLNLEGEIERLRECMYLSDAEAQAINLNLLDCFFKSELCGRILKAQNVKKEFRFLTNFSATDIYESLDEKFSNEKIVVQGAVDLLFVEDGKINIVDFKTDRNKDEEALVELYGNQLSIYSKACAEIFKMPIGELIIYSFTLGKSIKIK